eukprot:228220_1
MSTALDIVDHLIRFIDSQLKDESATLPIRAAWKCLDTNITQDNHNLVGNRSSHGISIKDDTLYLFGGETIPRTPIDSKFYVKNLTDDAIEPWRILPTNGNVEPIPRVAHAQAIIGDSIWIFGGRQGITMSEQPMNDLWKFHIPSKTWTCVKAEKNTPEPRSFHKMLSVGSKLYVFGGCGKLGRLSDLHCFNTENKTWENPLSLKNPSCLPGRGGAGFLASPCGTYLYVVGGFCGFESNAVCRFSLIDNSWTEIYSEGNNIIKPFSVSCGCVINNNLVFFGGEIDPSDKGHEGAGNFSNDLLILDGSTGAVVRDNCTISGIIPMARGWASAASYGNKAMVIFGGLSGNDQNPTRLCDTWILTFS